MVRHAAAILAVLRFLVALVEPAGGADLVGHPQSPVLLDRIRLLVHLDRRRTRALRLIRNLYLALTDLDSVSVAYGGRLTANFLLVGDCWQPLRRVVVFALKVTLCHPHRVVS